jgi:hypothetical protein
VFTKQVIALGILILEGNALELQMFGYSKKLREGLHSGASRCSLYNIYTICQSSLGHFHPNPLKTKGPDSEFPARESCNAAVRMISRTRLSVSASGEPNLIAA